MIRGARRGALIALAVVAVGVAISLATRSDDPDPAPQATAEVTDTTVADTTTTLPEEGQDVDPDVTAVEGTVDTPEYLGFRELPVACGGTLPDPALEMQFAEPGDAGIDPDATVTATLVTSCGEIELTLFPDRAPIAVNSFAFLAEAGYFDGTVSHRIVPGFVYQAGDPTATGTGGPGYRFEDELPAADFTYTRGTLAMANSGPNTNGSQFFIVFQDAGLSPDFTVFGEVTSGLDVLDAIEAVPVNNQTPTEGVFIEDIVIDVS